MAACVYHLRYFRTEDRLPLGEIVAVRLNNDQPVPPNFHSCPGIVEGDTTRDLPLPEIVAFLSLSCCVPPVALLTRATGGTDDAIGAFAPAAPLSGELQLISGDCASPPMIGLEGAAILGHCHPLRLEWSLAMVRSGEVPAARSLCGQERR